jgi:WD40 repeat protein
VSFGSEDGSLRLHAVGAPLAPGLALPFGSGSAAADKQADKVVGVFESLHHGAITCCAVRDDGKEIWTGGADALVCVWRLRKHVKGPAAGQPGPAGLPNAGAAGTGWALEQVECLASHKSRITCIAASQAQGVAVSGSKDCTAVLWDLDKKRFIRQLGGRQTGPIAQVSINDNNGSVLALSGADLSYFHINGDLLAVIHVPQMMHDVRLDAPRCAIATHCDDFRDGIVAVTGHAGGVVALWDLPERPGKRQFELRALLRTAATAAAAPVTALALDDTQRRLVSGDQRGHVAVWASLETALAPKPSAADFFSR